MVRYTRTGEPTVPLGTTGGAVANLPNYGVSVITSSADTYTLAPPEVGVMKTLVCTSTSTGARVIRSTTGSADQTITIGNHGATIITVADTSSDVVIQLIGLSSLRWAMGYVSTGAITPALSSG